MKKFIFLVLLFWAFFYSKAQVSLPHYDGINYPASEALQTQPGWTLLNSGDDIQIVEGSLWYPQLPLSTGNRIKFDGGGIDAAKAFTSQTSGTVYYSFLLNITNLGSLNNTTGGYFTGLTDASTGFGATVWVRANGSGFDIGLNPRTITANTQWSVGPYQLNTTYFIVVSYEIVTGTGNDIVKMWINPTPGQAMPTPTIQATNTGGTDLGSVQRILIRQDNASNTPFIEMDELRVGLNWSDVTPAGPTTINWANLQWPGSGTITLGDNFWVYAQAYIAGLTGVQNAIDPTPMLECWIGYNTENTNPNTWTNWIPAVFNLNTGINNNNDEFKANLGAAITSSGTYYYASRWRFNGGPYYYGGYNGGFWNGTSNVSGVLNVHTKPVISNVSHSPAIPRPTQSVTVTATITDDGSIQSAKLYYATTSGVTPTTGTAVTMTNTGGNTYSAQIPAQAVNTTIYYIIVATDNLDASTTSPEYNYTVLENQPPVISNVTQNPAIPSSQQSVTVTANITDADGTIATAKLYYSTTTPVNPSSAPSVDMTLVSGNTYSAVIPQHAAGTTVYYIIRAIDNEDGTTTTNEYNYTVQTNALPVIANVTHTPSQPTSQQLVTVNADVTDIDGSIISVTLYYSTTTPLNLQTATPITMTLSSGNTYTATIPPHPAGTTVYYVIRAIDNENGSSTTIEYSYTVKTNDLPVITNVSHNPTTPTSLDVVTVTADITDPDGTIQSAVLYYSTTTPVNPASAQSVTMNLFSGNTYRGFIPAFPKNTTVYYIIKATDNENGSTTSNEYNYTVTNPTATIQIAAFLPHEMFDFVGIIFNGKVPLTAAQNYKLKVGSGTTLQPLNVQLFPGQTNDTVALAFAKNSIPQDIVVDTLIEEFYSATYTFYASVIPIKYTNTVNPTGTIQNNIVGTFSGLVTADDEYNQVWIQDGCGPYNGVLIYSTWLKNMVNTGDGIIFIGNRIEYYGMTELIPLIPFQITQNAGQPCVTVVSSISEIAETNASNTNPAEKWEGQLVKVTNVKVTESLANYEYRATDGQYTIIIDDDAWYRYGNTTPFQLNKNYNITGVITYSYGKYKLNPRSAADIELVPVYDTSEFNAPVQQVPGGQINIAQINPQEILPVMKFNIVDPGQDGLPTIVEYFRIKIEAENTIDFLNDIDSGVFILNNTPIWPITNPQIVGNMLEFYFGNNQFVVPNGQTYEMLIKILPKPSAAGKTMKVSINTGNSVAYQPTVSSSPLKQVDDDIPSETFTFIYQTVKTTEITQNLVVYPNPASTVLYVPTQATKVVIYNNLGQKVAEYQNSSVVDVRNLTNGVYTIRVYTSDGKVAVTKFIKN